MEPTNLGNIAADDTDVQNFRCIDLSTFFIVVGTATEQLYGMLEAIYEPDLGPDELFEMMSQAFLNAIDPDTISGGCVVSYVMYSPADHDSPVVLKKRL
jgi:20S proteasome alpha/beta subunit